MKRLVSIVAIGAAATLGPVLAAPTVISPAVREPVASCAGDAATEVQLLEPRLPTSDYGRQAERQAMTLSASRLQAIRIGVTNR